MEPVIGIIKEILGFRQFSLRGLKKVTGEWCLVCLAFRLRRQAIAHPNDSSLGCEQVHKKTREACVLYKPPPFFFTGHTNF